ncbi:PPIL4 [Blepharisma stoltei]|uniref:Peptidyl-prolyl cis-trans isomerase n=1 Tax=Blepharisma stoltei TaxID=1481888 RepID=A0AAU9JRU6_9CILI|nr:unnamed protein product [Blepharisma stoltei]
MAVLLETSIGDIVIDLYPDLCPKTCLNFLKLCKIKHYNNSLFYNIEKNYTVKCGHLNQDNSIFGILQGQEKKYFEDEITPVLKHDRVGIVSMANRGPDMSASHFFITLGSQGQDLDRKHTIFGIVGEGLDIVENFNKIYCDDAGRPYRDIRIKHTYILEDPFPDLPNLIVPNSPEPVTESDRLLDNEKIDENIDEKQIETSIKENEAKTRAIVLEILGDLPDADIKPPENVAFVCRLNAHTTSQDLYVIFSRFGPIKSCEVVKDWKTGESLQYAFIEYENPRDCEEAVLKMDRVRIDERRIHVDFSQSVSKLWKKYRRGQSTKEGNQPYKIKDTLHNARFKEQRHKMVFDDSDKEIKKKKKREE